MNLVAQLRAARLRPRIDSYALLYEATTDRADQANLQLRTFNAAWTQSQERSSWARALAERFGLPSRFESWEAFDAITPIMDKAALRDLVRDVGVEGAAKGVLWRATGGSTAEPFRFPTWPGEHAASALDIWLGRRRLGVGVRDPLFLIWGHAHLLGAGVRGALNRGRRKASDWLLGYTRCSAYDLADADLERACDRLLAGSARYVIGYSTALDRFARVNVGRAAEIAQLGLKVVIATAESFPRSDSRRAIEACFGAPAVMEYGAVETGPLAYEDFSGAYRTFWARHRLTRRGGEGPSANELLVTSLYPRALPLLRYALGDLVEIDDEEGVSPCLTRIERIIGRCNEVVTLPNGRSVHSEAFTHCVRDTPGVRAFQILAAPGAWPVLRYEATAPLPGAAAAEIRRRLALIDPALASTPIEHADQLNQTVAGKHRMVVTA